MNVESKLSQGEVIAEVDLPKRNQPKQILFRARLPEAGKRPPQPMGRRN